MTCANMMVTLQKPSLINCKIAFRWISGWHVGLVIDGLPVRSELAHDHDPLCFLEQQTYVRIADWFQELIPSVVF